MIKVLQKTFGVFEYVTQQDHPVLPAELVRELKLPQPTAVRLLRELTELGYLEQIAPRKGYRPGPIPFRIFRCDHRRERFCAFAQPLIDNTARRLGQSVLFSCRHRHWRTILCHANYNPTFYVDTTSYRIDDLYCTVTGRVLLAYTPEEELDQIIETVGLPDPNVWAHHWDEATGGREALDRELSKIRQQGFAEAEHYSQGFPFHIYARPVIRNRNFLGAVGASHPGGVSPEAWRRFTGAITLLAETLSRSNPRTKITG